MLLKIHKIPTYRTWLRQRNYHEYRMNNTCPICDGTGYTDTSYICDVCYESGKWCEDYHKAQWRKQCKEIHEANGWKLRANCGLMKIDQAGISDEELFELISILAKMGGEDYETDH